MVDLTAKTDVDGTVDDSKAMARNPMWAFVAETSESGQACCQHPKDNDWKSEMEVKVEKERWNWKVILCFQIIEEEKKCLVGGQLKFWGA